MTAAFSRLPKVLLLDIDNTIYAYGPCHAAGLKHAFTESRHLNLWNDEDSFRAAYEASRRSVKSRIQSQAAGHSRLLYFKEMVEGLRGFTLFEQTCRLEQAYWEGYATWLRPDPECEQVLQLAVASGIRIAWISNFTTARQIWKLKHLGLSRLNSLLITSEEAGADKPKPAILDLALSRLGLDACEAPGSEAWFIGDESADVELARHRQLPILLMCREDMACTAAEAPGYPIQNWKQIGEVLRNARN
jgi:putative hydrolase of the HAD superfamily